VKKMVPIAARKKLIKPSRLRRSIHPLSLNKKRATVI
jgi:hypothetical protein